MKPAKCMYRFMSEWAGAGAGVARTITTITADPRTITVDTDAVMAHGDNIAGNINNGVAE